MEYRHVQGTFCSLDSQQCRECGALAQRLMVLELPRELERPAAEVVRGVAQRAWLGLGLGLGLG